MCLQTGADSLMPELLEEFNRFLIDVIQDKYFKQFRLSKCYYVFRHNASPQIQLDDIIISLANFRNDR